MKQKTRLLMDPCVLPRLIFHLNSLNVQLKS
uniref:Uncharacterized protein n=1 Tax=Arundo donax TaxID=35708 RepID=A0A0A9BUF5_ARUDO